MKLKAFLAFLVIAAWFSIYAWKAFTGKKEKIQLEEKLESLDQVIIENKNAYGNIVLIVVAFALGIMFLVDLLKQR